MKNYRTVFEEELAHLGLIYKKALSRILILCLIGGILLPGILLWFGQNSNFTRNLIFAIALNAFIIARFWVYPRLQWAKTQNHIIQNATIEDTGTIVLTTFGCHAFFKKFEPKQIVLHPHIQFAYSNEPYFLDRKWKHFPQSLDMIGSYSQEVDNVRYFILLHYEMAVKEVAALTIKDAILSQGFSSN